MDLYFDIPDDNISEPGLSDEDLYQFEQGMYEPEYLSYDGEQDINTDDDPLISIERIGSFKRKWKLENGKGYLFIKKRKSKKAPVMKGPIILGNKHYILSGWIRSGGKKASLFIFIIVSELEIDLKGNKSYQIKGTGKLRFSSQTAPKQPSYRGEINLDKDCYSLSAWKTSRRGKDILSINSHPIKTASYSDIQNDLEKWNNAISE